MRNKQWISSMLAVATVLASVLVVNISEVNMVGAAASPSVVWEETFEKEPDGSVNNILTYGAAIYDASGGWQIGDRCNGYIVDETSPVAGVSSGCPSPGGVINIAETLNEGKGYPPENAVLVNYTGSPGVTANSNMFHTKNAIPITPNRFFMFRYDAVGVNCFVNPPIFAPELIGEQGTVVSLGDTAPCGTNTTGHEVSTVSSGAFPINVPAGGIAANYDTVKIRIKSPSTSSTGNDSGVDNLTLLDVTPVLNKSFDPATVVYPATSTLKLTIENTAELAAKPGIRFTDSLPAGMTVAGAVTHTCPVTGPATSVTAPVNSTSVQVSTHLDDGQVSCVINVPVKTSTPGVFTNGASNISGNVKPPEQPSTLTVAEPPSDRGDAPTSYGTNGSTAAIHYTPTTALRLGATVDNSDSQTPASATADTDDLSGVDDEDVFADTKVSFDPTYDTTIAVPINNTSGTAATLAVWIDADNDGVFETTELTRQTVNNNTTTTTNIVVPAQHVVGERYMRIRLLPGNITAPSPNSTVTGGETEDYIATFEARRLFPVDCESNTGWDTSDEGWAVHLQSVGAGTTVPNSERPAFWASTGGNPGGVVGYNESADGAIGELWSPDLGAGGFITDYSYLNNQILTFDFLNNATYTNQPMYVAIRGANGKVYRYVWIDQVQVQQTWTRIRIPFDASKWQVGWGIQPNGQYGPKGSAPSETEFLAVLQDLERFTISVEAVSGPDNTRIDNLGLLCDDSGDLPDTYLTSGAAKGPAHSLSGPRQVFFGDLAPDVDSTIVLSAAADSDDVSGVDDEDGISNIVSAGTNLTLSVDAVNKTGAQTMIAVWVDTNNNGTFSSNELKTRLIPANTDSTVVMPAWVLPSAPAAPIAVRMRHYDLTRNSLPLTYIPTPGGTTVGGEVEDHQLLFYQDFGDAPASYDAGVAAAHTIAGAQLGEATVRPVMLGSTVDVESAATRNSLASGDDTTGTDDEDSVSSPLNLLTGSNTRDIKVVNNSDVPVTFAAWHDSDADGVYETTERVNTTTIPANTGATTIPVVLNVAAGASNSFVRFRIFDSVIADPSPTGTVVGGEVEDHRVLIGDLKVTKTVESVQYDAGTGRWDIRYKIVVAASGAINSPYDLADTTGFPTGTIIHSGSATSSSTAATASSTETYSGGDTWLLVDGRVLSGGNTDTYTVTYQVTAPWLTGDGSRTAACVDGGGFSNGATANIDGTVRTDDACGDPSTIAIEKTVENIVAITDGTVTVNYNVEVKNLSTVENTYTLVDTADFADGINIQSGAVTATSNNGAAPTVTSEPYTPAGWELSDGEQTIPANTTHTYKVGFIIDFSSLTSGETTYVNCEDGGGLANKAAASFNSETVEDDTCVELPLMSISKKVDSIKTDANSNGVVEAGDVLNYTIIVSNLGATELSGVTVTDSRITTLTCAYPNGDPYTQNGIIAAQQQIVCTGELTVTENDVSTGEVVNTATADSNETPPSETINKYPLSPLLLITKTVESVTSVGGGSYEISYVVRVENVNADGKYDLTDSFVFPAGTEVTSVNVVAPDGVPVNPDFDGGQDATAASNVAIGYGDIHVYKIETVVKIGETTDPTSLECGETSGGFRNTATTKTLNAATVTESSDAACAETPVGEAETQKTVSTIERTDANSYQIEYQIVVSNPTEGIAWYDLVDEFDFPDDITINSVAVSSSTSGVSTSTSWDGVTDTTIISDRQLIAGAQHVYKVVADVTVAATISGAERSCDSGGGFANTATATVGAVSDNSDACVNVPAPNFAVKKTVIGTPTANPDDTYQVEYEIRVTNQGPGVGQYDLTDQLNYGANITPTSVAVTSADITTTPNSYPFPDGYIVQDMPLNVDETDIYRMIVVFQMDQTASGQSPTKTDRDCILSPTESGTGLLNEVAVAEDGVEHTKTEACVQAPASNIQTYKTILSFDQTGDQYTIVYDVVVENVGVGEGSYTLNDTINFHPDIHVDTVELVGVTPASTPHNANWDGSSDIVLVGPNSNLLPGVNSDNKRIEKFTIRITGDIAGVVVNPGANPLDCVLDPGETKTGFTNNADGMSSNGAITGEACEPGPPVDLVLSKTVSAGPTLLSDGSYLLEYDITIENEGGPGSYKLDDTLLFEVEPDDGISVESVESVEVLPPNNSIVPRSDWNGSTQPVLIDNQNIGAAKSHVYRISLTVSAVPPAGVAAEPTGQCQTPGTAGGFANSATVTADSKTESAYACEDVPGAEMDVRKTVVSGPTDLGFGTTEIVYDLIVSNNGQGGDVYNLIDTIAPVAGGTATGTPILIAGQPAPNPLWNGVDATQVVSDKSIAAQTVHRYRVSVRYETANATATECGVDGGGMSNSATVSGATSEDNSKVCTDIPSPIIEVTKTAEATPQPTGVVNEFETDYRIRVVSSGPSGIYDLLEKTGFGDGVMVSSVEVSSTDVVVADENADPTVFEQSNIGFSTTDDEHVYDVNVVFTVAPSTPTSIRTCSDSGNGFGAYNAASITGPRNVSGGDDACVNIPSPEFVVSKTVESATMFQTDNAATTVYQISVANIGAGAGLVTVNDTVDLPDTVTVTDVAVESDAAHNPNFDAATDTVLVEGLEVQPAATVVWYVTVKSEVPAKLGNSSRDCQIGDGGFRNAVTVSGGATSAACSNVPAPFLMFDKQVVSEPTLLANGDYQVEYLLTTRNTGQAPGSYNLDDRIVASDTVAVTQAVPSSDTTTLVDGWDGIDNVRLVTDQTINPKQTDTVTVLAGFQVEPTANPECALSNGATLTTTDSLIEDSVCSDLPPSEITVTKRLIGTAPEPPYATDNIYTLIYEVVTSNTGDGPGSYTTIDSLTLPENVTVVGVEVSPPSTADGWATSSAWNGMDDTELASGHIAAQTEHAVTVTIQVDVSKVADRATLLCSNEGGGVRNTADLADFIAEPVVVCATLDVPADLELSKTLLAPANKKVGVGDIITYQITIVNEGTTDATGVVVADVLPASLRFVSGDANGFGVDGNWALEKVVAGETISTSITVEVVEAGEIVNVAEIVAMDQFDIDSTPANQVDGEDDQDDETVVASAVPTPDPKPTPNPEPDPNKPTVPSPTTPVTPTVPAKPFLPPIVNIPIIGGYMPTTGGGILLLFLGMLAAAGGLVLLVVQRRSKHRR